MPIRSGELASQGGVNPQTLRYYEREGLLPAPPRLRSGYRMYPDSAVRRVRFIKRAQELGFSLAEVRELLTLRLDKERDRANVREIARAKVRQIEGKIASLETIRGALAHLEKRCTGHGPAEECPILRAIDSSEPLL